MQLSIATVLIFDDCLKVYFFSDPLLSSSITGKKICIISSDA